MRGRIRAPQAQFVLERVLGTDEEGLTLEVRGFDLDVRDRLAAEASAILEQIPGVSDVETVRKAGVPQTSFRIDRAKTVQLGLKARQNAETIETASAGRRAGE